MYQQPECTNYYTINKLTYLYIVTIQSSSLTEVELNKTNYHVRIMFTEQLGLPQLVNRIVTDLLSLLTILIMRIGLVFVFRLINICTSSLTRCLTHHLQHRLFLFRKYTVFFFLREDSAMAFPTPLSDIFFSLVSLREREAYMWS